MAQNTSHAVMSQRHEPKESIDDFPTPPWATRALIKYALHPSKVTGYDCLEPACGRGYMSRTLEECFRQVTSSDKYAYGYAPTKDDLTSPCEVRSYDWVITNPPFILAEEFVLKSLSVAREGVAVFARTVFLESVGRYNRIFKDNPPSIVAQFTEHVPLVKGRADPEASTATGYAWFVWDKEKKETGKVIWIPPCRKEMEMEGDY